MKWLFGPRERGKPRIAKYSGRWYCAEALSSAGSLITYRGSCGHGASPYEAYQHWKAK